MDDEGGHELGPLGVMVLRVGTYYDAVLLVRFGLYKLVDFLYNLGKLQPPVGRAVELLDLF